MPKEEAILVDRAHEPEIVVTRSLRPAALPAEAAAYLGPRRRLRSPSTRQD